METNKLTQLPPEITFSEDQRTALNQIRWWLDTSKQELTLGGYAGTGKTTVITQIIKYIEDRLNYEVLCPTGKAAHVLRKKGLSSAATIHSHLYRAYQDRFGRPHFSLKSQDERQRDFIVVDESSMVNERLYRDLLGATDKILWVGDHGQLEPVGKHAHIMDDPEVRLEHIHRQAANNPLIAFATNLRLGDKDYKRKSTLSPELSICSEEELDSSDFGGDIVRICGFHKTRVAINSFFRERDSRKGVLEEGEPVICLRNDAKLGVFNGMMGTIETIHSAKRPTILCDIRTDSGLLLRNLQVYYDQFGQPNNGGRGKIPKEHTLWDYGYCITCHKSQGSEWHTVVVYEEEAPKLWTAERWAYTAATRASHRLIYYRKPLTGKRSFI